MQRKREKREEEGSGGRRRTSRAVRKPESWASREREENKMIHNDNAKPDTIQPASQPARQAGRVSPPLLLTFIFSTVGSNSALQQELKESEQQQARAKEDPDSIHDIIRHIMPHLSVSYPESHGGQDCCTAEQSELLVKNSGERQHNGGHCVFLFVPGVDQHRHRELHRWTERTRISDYTDLYIHLASDCYTCSISSPHRCSDPLSSDIHRST